MHGRGAWDACVDQPARRTHHPGAGHSVRKAGQAGLSLRAWGSTSLPSGTEPPCTGSVVSTSLPGGTQPPGLGTRVSTTEPGMNQHPVVRGRGVGRRCRPAGRRDSACGWGARGSNSRPGGSQPPGFGPRRSTSRLGGSKPPDAGLRVSVSSAVVSLRALGCEGRPARPAGMSLLSQAAVVDQPDRRDSASGRGAPASCTEVLSLLARTAGSTSQPGGTHRPGASHGVRPACQAGDSPRTLGCGVSQLGGTKPAGAGLRGSTLWPGVT